MKKLFPILLMAFGLVFAVGGGYAVSRGFDARSEVKDQLVAQNIVTPADASIPNALVDDIATARSMAEIIDLHARESTGGLTYSEMGRFAVESGDPAGTNDAEAALIGDNGQPVPNQLRNTAFQAASLQTSLYSSVMALEVGTLVIGIGALLLALGVVTGGVGVALAGLALPRFAERFHNQPVAVG